MGSDQNQNTFASIHRLVRRFQNFESLRLEIVWNCEREPFYHLIAFSTLTMRFWSVPIEQAYLEAIIINCIRLFDHWTFWFYADEQWAIYLGSNLNAEHMNTFIEISLRFLFVCLFLFCSLSPRSLKYTVNKCSD